MKVPKLIVAAVLTAIIALEAWTLREVVNLKVEVARLSQKLETKTIVQK